MISDPVGIELMTSGVTVGSGGSGAKKFASPEFNIQHDGTTLAWDQHREGGIASGLLLTDHST